MTSKQTRRRFLLTSGVAGTTFALAGCGEQDPEEPAPTDDTDDEPDDTDDTDDTDDEPEEPAFEATYEVWGLDQGTDTGYIYEPTEDDDFELVDEIDFAAFDETADDGIVPHMVDFTSDYEYAVVACTAGAQTLVIRTEDRELVAALDTGPGSHFSGVTPEEDGITVDVIGEGEIVKVDADFDAEEFEIVDSISIADDEFLADHGGQFSGAPICHQYDSQGRSIHTLGPSYNDGAVVVVDHEEFEIVQAWGHDELPANCGTVPHPEEDKFYLTAGLPTPTDDDGEPIEGEEGVGAFYVLDTANDELLVEAESTGGIDAHGFWYTPDGEELWVLNRETNDGVVIDPDTDEVVDEIDAYGPEVSDDPAQRDSPDIMWASPEGDYMFVTLRGSNPVSGDPHAATGVTPGLAVLDVETREPVEVLSPDADNEDSDFHAVGVRVTGDVDTAIPTSPTY